MDFDQVFRQAVREEVRRTLETVSWRLEGTGSDGVTISLDVPAAEGQTGPDGTDGDQPGVVVPMRETDTPTAQEHSTPDASGVRPVPDELTDEFIREIAQVYKEAASAGDPPTKTVMETYDRSRSAVSAWIRRARDAGHLPPTQPGVAKATTDDELDDAE